MGLKEMGRWTKAAILGGAMIGGASEARADMGQKTHEAPMVHTILSEKAALQEAGRLSMEALSSTLGNEEIVGMTEAEKLAAIKENFGTQTEHNWSSKLGIDGGKLFLEITITDAKGNDKTESYEVRGDALVDDNGNPVAFSLAGGSSREKKAQAAKDAGLLAAVRGDIARHGGKGSGGSSGPLASR